MISAITADPLSIGSIGITDYRARPTAGERAIMQDSTRPADKNATASEHGEFPNRDKPASPVLEPPSYDAASLFAAAVIAGTLPPAPTTMEELILRIGAIPIPPESEARLKDLLA